MLYQPAELPGQVCQRFGHSVVGPRVPPLPAVGMRPCQSLLVLVLVLSLLLSTIDLILKCHVDHRSPRYNQHSAVMLLHLAAADLIVLRPQAPLILLHQMPPHYQLVLLSSPQTAAWMLRWAVPSTACCLHLGLAPPLLAPPAMCCARLATGRRRPAMQDMRHDDAYKRINCMVIANEAAVTISSTPKVCIGATLLRQTRHCTPAQCK